MAALVIASVVAGSQASVARTPEAPLELTIFYGEGCPYCAAELAYLDELQARVPSLEVHAYEVWNDEGNRRRFVEMTTALGEEPRAVPTTIIGDEIWIGFDERIRSAIERTVLARSDPRSSPPPAASDATTIDVPLIGQVSLGDRSLVVATLAIGFVDGVNPCSLWVLTMLLALVLHGRSRRRVLLVGLTFLVVTATMYGLYIASFYSALSIAGSLGWIQRSVAIVVGVLGALQLADALELRGAPRLGIADTRKPALYRRMRALAVADRSVVGLMGATALLAVGVSLMETPCTAGLPMLWTGLLADQELGLASMVALFVLYLTVFLLDELLVLGAAVFTMKAFKLQEHHGRSLKLVSGVVMLSLAVVWLVVPRAMETLSGTSLVLAVTGVVAAGALALDRAHRGPAARGDAPA